jgi:hypothetical protein
MIFRFKRGRGSSGDPRWYDESNRRKPLAADRGSLYGAVEHGAADISALLERALP